MNIQIGPDGINWTDATWNPVTGCLHGCPYCYARAIAVRFGRSFEPAFHPEKLQEPLHRKAPTKIFVGSTADLFGNWVPNEWVRAVLKIVRQCPQHTFQFLTKAPHNLVKFNPWPDNCWVGATANNQKMMDKALFDLSLCKARVKFVSAEPLLGPISCDLSAIDWLIVGAQTGADAHQPKAEWVSRLIENARASGTAIWFKDNLEWPTRINEWPQVVSAPSQSPLFVLA
jgi:protein gp37